MTPLLESMQMDVESDAYSIKKGYLYRVTYDLHKVWSKLHVVADRAVDVRR
jgi:hypothetical protein